MSTTSPPAAAPPLRAPKSKLRLSTPVLVDLVAPLAIYWVLRRVGAGPALALTLGGLLPAGKVVADLVRHRRLDTLGLFVVAVLAVSIGLLFVTGDARFVLAKESVFTGAAGLYCLSTLLTRRPLAYVTTRPFVTRDDPQREARWDEAFTHSPRFRKLLQVVTAAWGVAFLGDALVRLVIVYSTSVDRAVALTQIPGIVLVVAAIVTTKLCGGQIKKLLDAPAAAAGTGGAA